MVSNPAKDHSTENRVQAQGQHGTEAHKSSQLESLMQSTTSEIKHKA